MHCFAALMCSCKSSVACMQFLFCNWLLCLHVYTSTQEPRLHPGASLEWKRCSDLPVGMSGVQAVLLGNRLYVGGGLTTEDVHNAVLFTCDFTVDTWSTIPTPTQLFALATYHSQLVLAGGQFPQPPHGKTNKLWVLGADGRTLNQPLPHMPTPRYGAVAISTDRHLIVAGGGSGSDNSLDVVEVFDGQQWAQTDPLPKECRYFQSTCRSDFCYLMGGEEQGRSVVYTSLRSLVDKASNRAPSTGGQQSVWKTLPKVPFKCCSTTVFGEALLAIGGSTATLERAKSSIFMYSALSRTWVKVGELPEALCDTCSITLPTGEVVVIGGNTTWEDRSKHVHKVTLTPGV